MTVTRRLMTIGFGLGLAGLAVAFAADKPEPKRRTDLPRKELKGPAGLEVETIELSRDDAVRHYYNEARVGDWVEFQSQRWLRRREVLDLSDEGMLVLVVTTAGGKTERHGLRVLFTGPKEQEKKKKDDSGLKSRFKIIEKDFKEKVKVGDQVLECDVHTREYTINEKKHFFGVWTSKDVPFAGVVKREEEDGYVDTLKAFGRGK